MEIKIEDLRMGDEVLIGSSMGLTRVKILRPLKMSKKKNWRGDDVYSKVKCAYNQQDITYTIPGRSYTYVNRVSGISEDIEYNKEKYVDFNYRKIWLVKREEQI
jgi:hypothetical protein